MTQPDTIVPDPYNSQDYDRYAYARNNPVRYTDPSGHVTCEGANWDDGPKCTSKSSFWAKATVTRFTNVTIKNSDDGNVQELRTLYNTLSKIYSAFGESSSAFNSAFGDVTFEIVPDGSLGEAAGMAYWGTGLIQLTHSAFSPYYDVSGWAIAHEMGHIFDARWSDGDPKKYYSNLFVEVLNGGCGHLGSNGCLGSNPPDGYSKWYYFGQDIGDYNPPSRQTTGYALEGGSMEDFAESFAATVLGDPHNYVHPKREFIIQTYINLVVSNSP